MSRNDTAPLKDKSSAYGVLNVSSDGAAFGTGVGAAIAMCGSSSLESDENSHVAAAARMLDLPKDYRLEPMRLYAGSPQLSRLFRNNASGNADANGNVDRWMTSSNSRKQLHPDPDSPQPPRRKYVDDDNEQDGMITKAGAAAAAAAAGASTTRGIAVDPSDATFPLLPDDLDGDGRFRLHIDTNETLFETPQVIRDRSRRPTPTSAASSSLPICLPSTPHALAMPGSLVSPMDSPAMSTNSKDSKGSRKSFSFAPTQPLKNKSQQQQREQLHPWYITQQQQQQQLNHYPAQRRHSNDARTATTVATGDTHTQDRSQSNSNSRSHSRSHSFSQPYLLGAGASLGTMLHDSSLHLWKPQPSPFSSEDYHGESLDSTTSPPPPPPPENEDGAEENKHYISSFDEANAKGDAIYTNTTSVPVFELSELALTVNNLYDSGGSDIEIYVPHQHLNHHQLPTPHSITATNQNSESSNSFDAEIRRSFPQAASSFSYSCATFSASVNSPDSQTKVTTEADANSPSMSTQDDYLEPISEENTKSASNRHKVLSDQEVEDDDGTGSGSEYVGSTDDDDGEGGTGLDEHIDGNGDDEDSAFDLFLQMNTSAGDLSSLGGDPMHPEDEVDEEEVVEVTEGEVEEEFTEIEVESSEELEEEGDDNSSSMPSDYFTSSVEMKNWEQRPPVAPRRQLSTDSDESLISDWCESIHTEEGIEGSIGTRHLASSLGRPALPKQRHFPKQPASKETTEASKVNKSPARPSSRKLLTLTQSKIPRRQNRNQSAQSPSRSRSKSQPPARGQSASPARAQRRQSSPASKGSVDTSMLWYSDEPSVYSDSLKGSSTVDDDDGGCSGSHNVYSDYSASLSTSTRKSKKLRRTRRAKSIDSAADKSVSTHSIPSQQSGASTADGILCPIPRRFQKKTLVKLSGRKKELKVLKDATGRLRGSKKKEVVWISGPSGVGKSALVESFCHQEESSLLAGIGGFEENVATALPFSGIAACLGDLLERMMSTADSELYKSRLQTGLRGESSVLALIVPGLSSFLDLDEESTAAVSDRILKRKFDRLRYAIRTFLAITCRYQSVMIVLDDLQWACPSSLQLLETFLTSDSVENLLVVACHRGLGSDHPLSAFKARLGDKMTSTVHLDNLRTDECKLLITRHLKRFGMGDLVKDPDRMKPLAASLYRKSSGNALLLTQLLYYLRDKKILDISNDYEGLAVDPTIPPTSAELAGARCLQFKSGQRLILKTACCLPLTSFRIETLLQAIGATHMFSKRKEEEECPVHGATSLKRLLESPLFESIIEEVAPSSYRFVHDAIRQGAQATLLPKGTKKIKSLHFAVGSDLAKLPGIASGGNFSFSNLKLNLLIADQKNKAIELIQSDKERARFAKLYLEISESLIEKATFALAASSLEVGISLLDLHSRWSSKNYKLTLSLFTTLGRAKYFGGKYDEAISFCKDAVKHAKLEKDKVGPHKTILLAMLEQKRYDEAGAHNVAFLKEMGEVVAIESVAKVLAKELELLTTKLKSSSDAELLTMPKMTHKRTLAIMSFLAILADIARLRRDNSSESLAAIHMIHLILQHGSCPSKSLAFSLFSSCLSRRGAHEDAFRYGRLAEIMSDRSAPEDEDALTNLYWNVHHWRRPYQESLGPLLRLSRSSLNACAVEQLPSRLGAYLSNFLLSGERLEPIEGTILSFQRIMLDYPVPNAWLVTAPYHLLSDLTGRKRLMLENETMTQERSRFSGSGSSGYARLIQHKLFFQMVRAFYFNEMDRAEKMRQQLFFKPDGVWVPFRAFVEGMIAASLARESSSGKSKAKHIDRARASLEQLEKWTLGGAVNCMHMEKLLKVEITMLSGRKASSSIKARYLFDAAIAAAAKGDYLHHRALASERAALYFVSVEDREWASAYMKQACRLYHSWGALGKVKQLAADYQEIIDMEDQNHQADLAAREQHYLSKPEGNDVSRASSPMSECSTDTSSDWGDAAVRPSTLSDVWQTIPTSKSAEIFLPQSPLSANTDSSHAEHDNGKGDNKDVDDDDDDDEVEPSKPSSLQRILGRSWNKRGSSLGRSRSYSAATSKSSSASTGKGAAGRALFRRKKQQSHGDDHDDGIQKKGRRNDLSADSKSKPIIRGKSKLLKILSSWGRK